jgi:hypothetical protein
VEVTENHGDESEVSPRVRVTGLSSLSEWTPMLIGGEGGTLELNEERLRFDLRG